MRHNLAHRKLGRVTEHRLALLRNQAIALLRHGGVNTGACRRVGRLVAVEASESAVTLATIARVLLEAGADRVERAYGAWSDRGWSDFEPVSGDVLRNDTPSSDRDAAGASG